jgi:hypothetical protein
MWGAFWMAFRHSESAHSRWARASAVMEPFPELGYWFIVMAAITWVCVGAAAAATK